MLDITYSIVSVIQYVIVANFKPISFHHYPTFGCLSLLLSAGLLSLLAFRFLACMKHKADYLIIAYTVASILTAINSIFVVVFMSLEMQGKPTLIDPS